ncbi:MAG: flavin reductase family protein [Methanomicrobiales archaeon]|nr:flavin reductase family protein [Methanomicrobiales archaeon]
MKQSFGPKTLLYPHPVLLVGTYDGTGRPDVMTAAWGGICSSQPPSVAVSIQRHRMTYANILATGAFTVSIPSAGQVAEADFFGIVSGKDADKFAATGFTPVRGDHVNAPFVGECPLVLECRCTGTLDIGVHTQFVGEILDVKIETSVLDADGKPDIEKIRPFAYDSFRREYVSMGSFLAPAFSAGRAFLPRKEER